jgi:MYXO-CTERM domain-containing protein
LLIETSCADIDGDGEAPTACGGTDCDDDPSVCGHLCRSGGDEVCDGYDNNCDGTIDETGCVSQAKPEEGGGCACSAAPTSQSSGVLLAFVVSALTSIFRRKCGPGRRPPAARGTPARSYSWRGWLRR